MTASAEEEEVVRGLGMGEELEGGEFHLETGVWVSMAKTLERQQR